MSLLAKFEGKKSDSLDDLRNDIIENLSGILSSRAPMIVGELSDDSQAQSSIVNFGLRNTTRFHKKFGGHFVFDEILELIKKFEPRLLDVSIEQKENAKDGNMFEFRISAVIQFEGSDDSIQFESCLDFGSNIFKVRKVNFV